MITAIEVFAPHSFQNSYHQQDWLMGPDLNYNDMTSANPVPPVAVRVYLKKYFGHGFYSCLRNFVLLIILSCFPALSYPAEITLNAGLPSFPPFAYPPTANAQRGISVEIYKILEQELRKELDISFNIQHYPYPRTLVGLQDGTLDLAIIFKNLSLQGKVSYVAKVSHARVIVISDKNYVIKKYDDLYELDDIAVIRQANYGSRFDRDEKINKYPVKDYRQGIQMLQLGRVAAVVGSQIGLQYTIDTFAFNGQRWAQPYVLGHKESWLHFSNKSSYQHLIPAIKRAVNKIYKEDLVYQLYEHSLKEK